MNNIDKAENSGNDKVVKRNFFVVVPRGWSRGLEKDSVFYISPSSEYLRSREDVIRYLISDKTCKCGLECPIFLDKTFNFDASVPSRHQKIGPPEKVGHKTMCSLTASAANTFKNKTTASDVNKVATWIPNHHLAHKKSKPVSDLFSKTDNNLISNVCQLPSFETFTNKAILDHTSVQEQTKKVKKPSQPKKTSCSKRKAGTSLAQAVSKESSSIEACTTVHSTNAPIPHSYVKSNIPAKRFKEAVVSAAQYPARAAVTTVTRAEGQHAALLNPVSVFPFPSSLLNASSYLASLSSSGTSRTASAFTPGRDGVKPLTTSLASKLTLGVKPSVHVAGHAQGAKNKACLPSDAHIINNSAHLNITPLPAARVTSLETPSPGISQPSPFSLSAAGNVRSITAACSTTSSFMYLPPHLASATATYCTSSNSTKSCLNIPLKQTDLVSSTKTAVSAHVQQTPQMNSTLTSAKRDTTTTVNAGAALSRGDKHKPNTTITSSVSASESVTQPLQYCGILLHPSGGVVPQVQVATSNTTRTPNLGAINFQNVDPTHLTGFNVLPGIPLANNVTPLGGSTVLGMPPGTFVPYVLGIAPNVATSRPTTTTTTKVPNTSTPSASVVTTVPSTGSAAIAAAYSAFVSIAPASDTSSNYSQQLMGLVSNYNHSYWQQFLSHGAAGSNALAYQLMQMNQYAALRASAGQQAGTTKATKPSGQHQTKQTSSTINSSSSATPRSVAVVVGGKDASSSTKTTAAARSPTTVKTALKSTVCVASSVTKSAETNRNAEKQQVTVSRKTSTTTSVSTTSNTNTVSASTSRDETSQLNPNIHSLETQKESDESFGLDRRSSSYSCETLNKSEPVQKPTHSETFRDCGTSKREQNSLAEKNELLEKDERCLKLDHESLGVGQGSGDNHQGSGDNQCLSIRDQCLLKDGSQQSLQHNSGQVKHGRQSSENNQEALDQFSTEGQSSEDYQAASQDVQSLEPEPEQLASEPDQLPCVKSHPVTTEAHHQPLEQGQRLSQNDQQLLEPNIQSTEQDHRSSERQGSRLKHDQISSEHDQQSMEVDQQLVESDKPSVNSITELPVKHDQQSVEHDQQLEQNRQSVERDEQFSTPSEKSESIVTDSSNQSSSLQELEPHTLITEDVEQNRCASERAAHVDAASDNLCRDTAVHENSNDKQSLSKNDSASVDVESHDTNIKLSSSLPCKAETEDAITDTKESNTLVSKDTNCQDGSVSAAKDRENNKEDISMETIPAIVVTNPKRKIVKGRGVVTKNSRDSTKFDGQDNSKESKVNRVKQDDNSVTHNINSLVENGGAQSTSNADTSDSDATRGDPIEFTIGDVVWAQARGLPSWPGKIVDAKDVIGGGRADDGKKWVMWFGDHTFSQVEVEKLKTLTEGLKTLDDKGKKRKYRGKKTRMGLEQAISEALEELDDRQNSRSRQASKAKKRRLRV